jgi:hypothetical protein
VAPGSAKRQLSGKKWTWAAPSSKQAPIAETRTQVETIGAARKMDNLGRGLASSQATSANGTDGEE